MTGPRGAGGSLTTWRASGDRPGAGARRFAGPLVLAILLGISAPGGRGQAAQVAAGTSDPGWVEIDYQELIDRRRLTHSGESVGTLLGALEGRGVPPPGERPGDLQKHALLDPLLEHYAFVLADTLDAADGVPGRAWFEVGALWAAGSAQPAWAELLRARRYLVESDGQGRLRLCLPWAAPKTSASAGSPANASAQAARESYEAAWPVLRHVFAAERRRLAKRDGDRAEDHPLDVECHAYVHEQARTLFHLGMGPYRTRVTDTLPSGARPPLDLQSLQDFLDRGLRLEGGRLDADGTFRPLGSQTRERPSLLGRPVALSDYAVAYRAVSHGGLAEPYMSLDRGMAPQTSVVNYGGRLRDTSLGLVSLLCDIRFKTFSMGIDVVPDRDVREAMRREIPSFRTHLERLAADPRSSGMQGQQTRLWFYPDDVDLTLSEQGDVLVLRKCRMTASSERVEESGGPKREDPPWTTETVAAINRDYDKLGRFFPELNDLDEVVRMLSLFTWLNQAQAEGHLVPEFESLLALELPAEPTPREFPQLLAFNALPPPGGNGRVDVFSRLPVGEALDRLAPASGAALPATERFERAIRGLDRRLPDHAALAQELEAKDASSLDGSALDALAFRAERLRMHQLVLSTLPGQAREALVQREQAGEKLRVFSVGIGGLDLGMRKSLERASRRSEPLRPGSAAAETGTPASVPARSGESAARGTDPDAGLPETLLPEHGPPPAPGANEGTRSRRDLGLHSVETGSTTLADGRAASWVLTVLDKDGPDPTSRRLLYGPGKKLELIERLDREQFLRFRIEGSGPRRAARRQEAAPQASAPPAAQGAGPADLAILELTAAGPRGTAGSVEAPTVLVKLRTASRAEMAAPLPRAVLQRLILGPDVDLTPGQPLPGLGSPASFLNGLRHVMVLARNGQNAAPWETPLAPVPGEEDPVRVARALRAWWDREPAPPGVVVGSDAIGSPGRWGAAPRPGQGAALLLPAEAFSGRSAVLREQLAAAWAGGNVLSDLATPEAPTLVVLASAEAPDLLGARLRRLARAGALKGKLLAVYALGGPVRPDLPAALLAEGNLAGVGVAQSPPVGSDRAIESIRKLAAALRGPADVARRVEDLPGPFLWFF